MGPTARGDLAVLHVGAVLVALLASCRASPPPAPLASPTASGPDPSAGLTPAQRGCVDAEPLFRQAEAALHPKPGAPAPAGEERCAVAVARRAAQMCPADKARGLALAALGDERERTRSGLQIAVSPDKRYVLQSDGTDSARVWELTAGAPQLRWRLSMEASWEPATRGRFFGWNHNKRLFVLDLPAGVLSEFPEVEGFGLVGESLMLASKRAVRRVEWANVSQAQVVTAPADISIQLDGPFALLAGGRSVIAGDTLASFERGVTLAQGLRFVSTSADERRVLGCTDAPAAPAAVVLDALSGQKIAEMDTSRTALCGFTRPALSPDGRYVVGVDEAITPANLRYMVLVVFDTATGRSRRLPTPRELFSTALDASITVSPQAPSRVCVRFGNMHWRQTDCPWLIDAYGKATTAPPARKPGPDRPPVPGLELARAKSPDGRLVVVASYRDRASKADGPRGDHLRLSVIDAEARQVLRSAEVVKGPFSFMVMGGAEQERATLRFLSPRHVLFECGQCWRNEVPTLLFDVEQAGFETLDPETAPLAGSRFATLGDDLLDLTTGRRYSLTPDQAAWQAAPQTSSLCAP